VYLDFYGLKEKPFNTTPDPRFLYPTRAHREALAQLNYAVRERKGFMVLTGDVGTGKTTLLQALLQRLDGRTAVAFVVNSSLGFDGLLEYVLEDFGIAKGEASRAQRLIALNAFLIERQRAGQKAVVIIDEAQNLDPPTLEQIRLLSNFETTGEKLLQIILVGQPELRERLQLPELRQLRQRVALRTDLPPLARDEVREYIRFRLRAAGYRDPLLFSVRAAARVAAYSRGIPRVVNLVCDHALVTGYAERRRRIDVDLVDQAIAYLEAGEEGARRRWWRRVLAGSRRVLGPVVAGAVLGVTGVAVGFLLTRGDAGHLGTGLLDTITDAGHRLLALIR
jgi:general secretion pathway protein A